MDLPEVFNRFSQAQHGIMPVTGGAGIGLALCQAYMQLFNGKIAVDSTFGKGSRFTITFPVKLVSRDAAESVAYRPITGVGLISNNVVSVFDEVRRSLQNKGENILIVEDNQSMREYFHILLRDHYHLEFAKNGQEAIDKLGVGLNKEVNSIDLIISDLMMPVMNGYELLKRVKAEEDTWHIPFMMITARGNIENKLDALRVGVDDFLTKPFINQEFFIRIQNLLKNKGRRKAIIENGLTDEEIMDNPSLVDQYWLKNLEDYLEQNLIKKWLSVPIIANHFNMSESTLLRQLKRLTGLTPAKYLRELRLKKASHLLEIGQYHSVVEVALEVGFKDSGTLTKNFKKRFGKLPSDILNRNESILF